MTRACPPYFLTQIRGQIYFNCTERPSPLGRQNSPHKLHYQDKINYSTWFLQHFWIDLSTSSCPDRLVLTLHFRHEVWPTRKDKGPINLPRTPTPKHHDNRQKEEFRHEYIKTSLQSGHSECNQLGFYCVRYFKGGICTQPTSTKLLPIGAKAQMSACLSVTLRSIMKKESRMMNLIVRMRYSPKHVMVWRVVLMPSSSSPYGW
jgi:hypothetical protein